MREGPPTPWRQWLATCLPAARKSLSSTSNWIDTVDAIYRELVFRAIWRDYHRQLAHHLRGESPQDEGDAAFDDSGDSEPTTATTVPVGPCPGRLLQVACFRLSTDGSVENQP